MIAFFQSGSLHIFSNEYDKPVVSLEIIFEKVKSFRTIPQMLLFYPRNKSGLVEKTIQVITPNDNEDLTVSSRSVYLVVEIAEMEVRQNNQEKVYRIQCVVDLMNVTENDDTLIEFKHKNEQCKVPVKIRYIN